MEGVMILSAILTAIAFLAGFLTGIRAGERAGRAEERALLYEAIQEVFLKTPEDGEAEAGGPGKPEGPGKPGKRSGWTPFGEHQRL